MQSNLRSIFGAAAFLFLMTLVLPVSAQIITNVTPPLGGHGELVPIKILGNGFAPGGHRPNKLSVDFNGTLSTSNTNSVVSDSEIDITNVPAAATSGYIHVSINNGVAIQSPQPFVIVPTNMPYATNFTPIFGANGSAVIINGVHFVTAGVNGVNFNGVGAASYFKASDNEIDVTAPANVATGPIILQSSLGATHNFSTATNIITTATNFFVQPAVTSFSPATGRPDTNVVIKGANFIGCSAVQFGGVNASFFSIVDNNTIQATVATNVSTGIIAVSPPSGTIFSPASSPTSFKMLPTIYNVSPGAGSSGTLVIISGAGLNEKSPQPDVSIGGGSVTSFGTITPNALSFNVPATAVSGFITITTTNGSVTSTQLFYLPASISSFTPIGGPAGTIVKIIGNNFTNASAVLFNGVPANSFAITNNNTIGAVAPSGVASGVISITTPFGTTNSATLFYAPPTISSFTPTHGLPGLNVVVSGQNFTNATAVLFNGTPAASFVVSNNTTLSAIVPTNVTSGKITIAAPGGTNSSATDFTVDSADLSVGVSAAPDPVFVGSNLVYTVTVTNDGPVADTSVFLSNALPASVKLASVSAPIGSIVSTNGSLAVFNLGTMGVNASVAIGLTVIPQIPGLITNTAWVAGVIPDPNLLNNTNSVHTTVWPLPLLSIKDLMTNNLVQISWPAPLSNFTLQFRGDLTNTSWTNETAAKILSGTNVLIIESNSGFPRFFRLTN